NGTAVKGATATTYRVSASDLRPRLAVRVTGRLADADDVTATSVATAAVVPGVLVGPSPFITGKAVVGRTLVAHAAGWPAGTRVTYQWLRNGRVIKGATRSTYKVVKKDRRARISVRITATLPGYTTSVRTSAATAKVTLEAKAPKAKGR